MPIEGITVKIGPIEGTWKPNTSERDAAWEMYVELVTRISVQPLKPDEGLLREALTSLHSLFGTTREILRRHGPAVAGGDSMSFGFLAVAILNEVLRPMLAKWHPLLEDWENRRDPQVSRLEHERTWDKADELRSNLKSIQVLMSEYAKTLADVARVPSLTKN